VAFTKVLIIYQIYHTWIHSLHHSSLSPPLIPEIVSKGIMFPFTCMCTQYLHPVHPPIPFPHVALPTGTNITRQDLFCSSALRFYKRKMIFLFICDSYTGNFLVAFPYVYVLLINFVCLLYFSSFCPSPTLMVVSKVYIHSCVFHIWENTLGFWPSEPG
jgi:hypothetical protein